MTMSQRIEDKLELISRGEINILDQDFVDLPWLELEIIGHLAAILSWRQLVIWKGDMISTSEGCIALDLENVQAELTYLKATRPAPGAEEPPLSPSSKYEANERMARLCRRKDTFDRLCALKHVVQGGIDACLLQSTPGGLCGLLPVEQSGCRYRVSLESMPGHEQKMIKEGKYGMTNVDGLKYMRRAVLIMYVSCIFYTFGTPTAVIMADDDNDDNDTWIQPLLTESLRKERSALLAEIIPKLNALVRQDRQQP